LRWLMIEIEKLKKLLTTGKSSENSGKKKQSRKSECKWKVQKHDQAKHRKYSAVFDDHCM